ncbi:MAG: DUF2842 domain-containing protein [Pseudomonadota bacterium]
MKLSYKARKRWALVILVLGLPIYIVSVVTVLNLLGRPPKVVEFFVYVGLGILWAVPVRFIFKGIGQPDPDDPANH